MSGWRWIALVPERTVTDVPDALAVAGAADPAGDAVGVLAAWPAGRKPAPDALRCDATFVDPGGAPAWVSYLTLPPERSPLFDDPAVSEAMREVLRRSAYAA